MEFRLIDILVFVLGGLVFWVTTKLTKRSSTEEYANKFIIEQDNIRLRHENYMLASENDNLKNRILELEKRVHELEVEIKYIKSKI